MRVLHYHLSEIYRLNPAVILYVGIFDKPAAGYTFAEVKTMQNYAGGKIRQLAVWCGDMELVADDLTKLQEKPGNLKASAANLLCFMPPRLPLSRIYPTIWQVKTNAVCLL